MDKNSLTKRQISALETRRKIYDTAKSLFHEYGYDNVSVDTIVENAGVSKGSFYVYFESKDALIGTIIAEYVKNADLNYRTFLESLPENISTSDMLISFVAKIIDILSDTIGYDLLRILYEGQISRKLDTNALLDYQRDLYRLFDHIIERGISQGEFKTEIPLDTIANQCILIIRAFAYEWCVRYPDFDFKSQTLTHFKLLLKGIEKQREA